MISSSLSDLEWNLRLLKVPANQPSRLKRFLLWIFLLIDGPEIEPTKTAVVSTTKRAEKDEKRV